MTRLINFLKNKCTENEVLDFLKSKYEIIFNVSYVKHAGVEYYTARVSLDIKQKPSALLIMKKGDVIECENLSNGLESQGILNVADPKLLLISDNVFITFNTGFSETCNDIFLCRIGPKLKPMRCVLSDRNKVEKNWAFFNDSGELFALYSVSPLVILKEKSRNNEEIVFEKVFSAKSHLENYSIGSQLVKYLDEYLFLSHKKIYLFKKRAYLIRPMKLRRINNRFEINISRGFFVFSLFSLLGKFKKFNKNLISCTYASGLFLEDNNAFIGIGINDLAARLLVVKRDALWE